MQDILDVLISRKSIRRYKPDPVPDEMIDKILEAARWAPSGENYQPWRFVVIRDLLSGGGQACPPPWLC